MSTRTILNSLPFLAVVLTAGCDSKTLESVDIVAENNPPLAVSVSGTAITIPEGIAVAVVVTPHVDGKVVDDEVEVQCFGVGCTAVKGRDKNEFFIIGYTAGAGTLTVTDSKASSLNVPVTCTVQP
jgi:hypothetical protein